MRRTRSATILAATSMATALVLTGCNVLPGSDGDASSASNAMTVEVQISSDAATADRVQVNVDARNDPQRVDQSDALLPYKEAFEVPLDTPFPLTGTSVEATAATDASWVECQITLDGEVVATDRAEGAGAIAVCEKKLRLGPQ